MAIWYEVEKSEAGIRTFLDWNEGFHDFRPERVEYVPGKDMVEIFLNYDTGKEGVLLRFSRIHGIHINTKRDYEAEWIFGSAALLLEDSKIIWLDEDVWGEENRAHLDELKQYTTWVEAERIFWAVTDADGTPVERLENRTRPGWAAEEPCFDLKEFTGDWDKILIPYA